MIFHPTKITFNLKILWIAPTPAHMMPTTAAILQYDHCLCHTQFEMDFHYVSFIINLVFVFKCFPHLYKRYYFQWREEKNREKLNDFWIWTIVHPNTKKQIDIRRAHTCKAANNMFDGNLAICSLICFQSSNARDIFLLLRSRLHLSHP